MTRSDMTIVLGRCTTRRGTALVECAITLPLTLFVLFSLLDLGLMVTRYNSLSEASRRIARQAILHGSLAPEIVGTWGPDEVNTTVDEGTAFVSSAYGATPTMKGSQVNVRLSWPDGGNNPRDRVQVDISYVHVPLVPALCPWGPVTLHASTTMHVVN